MVERDIDTRPMTLEVACEQEFAGAIKPASLKAEARRGNLTLIKIGRRYFVTKEALREMQEKCRVTVAPRESASGSSRNDATGRPETSSNTPSGSSETERASVALAALRQTSKALKSRSQTTSPAGTGRKTRQALTLVASS